MPPLHAPLLLNSLRKSWFQRFLTHDLHVFPPYDHVPLCDHPCHHCHWWGCLVLSWTTTLQIILIYINGWGWVQRKTIILVNFFITGDRGTPHPWKWLREGFQKKPHKLGLLAQPLLTPTYLVGWPVNNSIKVNLFMSKSLSRRGGGS